MASPSATIRVMRFAVTDPKTNSVLTDSADGNHPHLKGSTPQHGQKHWFDLCLRESTATEQGLQVCRVA